MEETTLTSENYHSTEMRKAYMGYSQFMSFRRCEKEGLEMVLGNLEEKPTDAFTFGGYIDAYFSNELDSFVPKHPELFNSRTGELKSQFKNIEVVIKAIEEDEMLMKYLSGEHQVIMVGEISGVPFKIKIDALHRNKLIVDQKIMKDMEDVWVEKNGKNVKVSFIEAYGYIFEGAIYQEIERQTHLRETGEDRKLPFVLAVTTKEEYPDKALIKIDQEYLDEALEIVKEYAPRYQAIKEGKIAPKSCGKCGTCRKSHKLTTVKAYSKMFGIKDDFEY